MDPRHRLLTVAAVAVAAALLLAGCASDAPDAPDVASDPGPIEQETNERAGIPDDDAPDDAPGDGSGSEGGSVPPLHPVIDDWDEVSVTIRTTEGDAVTVAAKAAVTDAQRQRGLMEVEDLPDGVGMLFVFETERLGGFWMRNTLVPLDIAYVDDDGTIGTILAMDPCVAEEASDCTIYTPDDPYVAALEMPQGWFGRVGVAEGDTVRWTEPRSPHRSPPETSASGVASGETDERDAT